MTNDSHRIWYDTYLIPLPRNLGRVPTGPLPYGRALKRILNSIGARPEE